MITFKNRFGTLTLTPVTEYMPVNNISFSQFENKIQLISLEDAEKVGLITENTNIHLLSLLNQWQNGLCYSSREPE